MKSECPSEELEGDMRLLTSPVLFLFSHVSVLSCTDLLTNDTAISS